MRKLLRYLKPYALLLITAVVLLFGQALCDLNLPNFMSKIVNVGIQQGGIENAVPQALSEGAFETEKFYLPEADGALLDASYTLVQSGGSGKEYDRLLRQYPKLAEQNIYVQNAGLSKETLAELNRAFGAGAWTYINTVKDLMSETPQSGKTPSSQGGMAGFDASSLDWNKVFRDPQSLPKPPGFDQLVASARGQAETADASMLDQTGTIFVRGMYEQLGVDTASLQLNYIVKIGLIMLLIAMAGGVATVLVGYLAARISAGFARDIRGDVFGKVESFSNGEFDKFSTSSLITRTTNDITQVQMLIMMGIRMLCYAPVMGVGGIIMAVGKSANMSWILALACVLLIGIVVLVFSLAMPKFKLVQKLIDKLNLVSRENLNGLMVIRAFGTQQHEKDRFDRTNRDLTKTTRFVNRILTFMMPSMMLIMNGISLLVVWTGAHQIAESTMQVGDMMAFIQYSMQIIMAFLFISMIFILVPRAAVSGDRIQEVLETEPAIRDPESSKAFLPAKMGVVEFQNVSFRYAGADEDVIRDISFTAQPGQTTAIIGATGSGKTTLVNLIPRFYDVTGGRITVNGVDVRDVKQHELHETVGFVPQKGVLLSGTIASNLRYGAPDASDELIETVARVAQAGDFIAEKEEGFDSPISQGGTNVSGGQKQRLSIARALAKGSPIYIFDDSFSALDFKTDATLRRALKEHTGNATVIIVAQRVSTILQAEQILVLDEGRLVGRGTHAQLLQSCPEYHEIAASQLTKEEMQ